MPTELWKYRSFILGCVKREFHSQYTKSLLGSLWIVINPLYMCIIYTIIFSSVMKTDGYASYTIYVAAGLLAWNFFIDIFTRGQRIYINYYAIIKKQYFPLICMPIIVVLLAWIDCLISFGIFSLYLLFTGEFPGWCYFGLIPVLVLQTLFGIGLSAGLGMINIFFKDVEKGLAIFLQTWFWVTPIVYFIENLPTSIQHLLMLNPLTSIMNAYQSILAKHQWPNWTSLLFPLLLVLFNGLFSLLFYRKYHAELLDEL